MKIIIYFLIKILNSQNYNLNLYKEKTININEINNINNRIKTFLFNIITYPSFLLLSKSQK